MLTIWLTFFILGGLFGRITPLWSALRLLDAPTLALLLTVVVILCRHRPRWRFALGPLAWLWGFGHAAPILSHDLVEGEIARVASADPVAAGPLLVRVGPEVFESYGPQIRGALVSARVLPQVRLFARYAARVRLRYAPPASQTTPLGEAVAALRRALAIQLEHRSPFIRHWLGGILLGETTALPASLRDAFKRTGLYHLLAVSGMHVSLIAWLLAAMIRAPAQLAYACRIINPLLWRQIAGALHVAAAVIAVVYLAATGAPVAAQRAALVFILWQLGSVFCGVMPLPLQLRVVAVAQSLAYPLGFLSEAALMSWAAYLLVLDRPVTPVRGAVYLQLKLSLLVTAVFGQLCLLGIAANLLLVPVFSLLLTLALGTAVWPSVPGGALVLALQRSFVEMVRLAGELCLRYPWLAPSGPALPPLARPLAAVLSAVILLNTCRNLSISPYESH